MIQQFAGEGNYAQHEVGRHGSGAAERSGRNSSTASTTSACSIRWARRRSASIVDIQLAQLKKRLLDRNLELTLDDSALDRLSEAGYDPVYGARPLKRAIQQQVENPLAQAILSGKFLPGDRIKAHANGNGLEFAKER